jgi:hypothetical protein
MLQGQERGIGFVIAARRPCLRARSAPPLPLQAKKLRGRALGAWVGRRKLLRGGHAAVCWVCLCRRRQP